MNTFYFKQLLIVLVCSLCLVGQWVMAHPSLGSVFNYPVLMTQLKVEKKNNQQATQQSKQQTKQQANTKKNNFLPVLKTPIVAYILFILGCYFIVIELTYFGMVLPGVIGLVCVVLGLYGFLNTDYNTYLALLLLLLSIVLMTAEIHVPSSGVFLLLGVMVFLGGSYWLFTVSTNGVPWSVVGVFAVVNLCFFGSIVYFMKKTYAQKAVSGIDIMIGSTAQVVEVTDQQLKVSIEGEVWKADSEGDEVKIGDLVQVEKVNGLTLAVKKIIK